MLLVSVLFIVSLILLIVTDVTSISSIYSIFLLKAFQQERDECINRIPPEPAVDDPSAIHINIRMPDGERIERRFLASDSLQVIKDRVGVSL